MIPSHDLSVRSGHGWAIVGTDGIRREGQMLVELTDGSTQPLDAERDWSTSAHRSLAGVVNIGSGLAKALVIAR
jgi:hypothetical protein